MSTAADLSLLDYGSFAIRLALAVEETNREMKMSVEVRGLAETVRRVKSMIAGASNAALRMQDSADQLTRNLGSVDGLTRELDAANAELQAAVGTLSNGGPPLDVSTDGVHQEPPIQRQSIPGASVEGSIRQIAAMNANPEGNT